MPIKYSLSLFLIHSSASLTTQVSAMGHDHYGQLHAGSIGLFDSADEIEATESRVERQRAIAEAQERRWQEKQRKKVANRNQRIAERKCGEQALSSRIGRMFRFEGKAKSGTKRLISGICEPRVTVGEGEDEDEAEPRSEGAAFTNVELFELNEVDAKLDFLFYAELTLVMITAENNVDVRGVKSNRKMR
ncbi:hypothetical protein N0V90_011444 [Kalmusia sp. IMI 367209]|nr:hypothetical protein N0V90_011444 [Kalmusia sp. IMI 367209]